MSQPVVIKEVLILIPAEIKDFFIRNRFLILQLKLFLHLNSQGTKPVTELGAHLNSTHTQNCRS